MIFKKWKNIIGMYFDTKSYLKSNHYHTAKHPLENVGAAAFFKFFFFVLLKFNIAYTF